MDDCQLRVGVRNEYWSNLASVIPSHRAFVLPGKVFSLLLVCQTGTILGAIYAYIVSDFKRFSGLVYILIVDPP